MAGRRTKYPCRVELMVTKEQRAFLDRLSEDMTRELGRNISVSRLMRSMVQRELETDRGRVAIKRAEIMP